VALNFGPPVLADDDPVVLQVLRMCGAQLNGALVVGGGGLSLTDIKAFCFDNRDEYRDYLVISEEEGEVWTDTRWWGADAVLHDGYDIMPVDVALPHQGYWKLATAPGIDQTLYLHGYLYDVNLAAADTLEAWADRLKLEFDFNDGSGTYSRSQKVQNLLQMADRYRKRGRIQNVPMVRSDYSATHGGSSLPMPMEGWEV
jgi:hypothetical protein